MIYLALLRGINVGGNSKVEMPRLKALFEGLGFTEVRTYINSGNVVFSGQKSSEAELAAVLEKAFEREFGFEVKFLIRTIDNLRSVVGDLPKDWKNDAEFKTDVMFLWPDFDIKGALAELELIDGREQLIKSEGALLWNIDRKYIGRSKVLRLVGSEHYKKMTVRNCNTTRKLLELMEAQI